MIDHAIPGLQPVDDPGDPRLADYVHLRDVNLRRRLETEHGLFIAEGAKVIRRAVQAGYRPRSFLLAERWLESLADLLTGTDVPVYLVSEQVAEQVTGFHVHRGALASMHRRAGGTVEQLLTADRLVVCEDIVDHTNVGALFRVAAGLGWDGVLLSPRCADPLYRRSIKVAMGAVFSMPWARLPDWSTALPTLQRAGYTTIGLALAERAEELELVRQSLPVNERVAVLVGTEGAGLSDHWLAGCERLATIPMHAGIDSLNVAAATAIACYALGPR